MTQPKRSHSGLLLRLNNWHWLLRAGIITPLVMISIISQTLTFAKETCKAWSGRVVSSEDMSVMFSRDRQVASPWSSLFTSTLMDFCSVVAFLSTSAKTQHKKKLLNTNQEDMELKAYTNHIQKPGLTFSDSTDLHYLSPAPLLLLWEPAHDFGSNVWNSVLLRIRTTCWPAAANHPKITSRNMD